MAIRKTKKRIIIIITSVILIASLLIVTALFWKQIYYGLKCVAFSVQNNKATERGVVFTGDSITDFCDLDKYYPELDAYNRGISADTTSGLLKRLKQSIFDLNPSVVVILMGINDLMFYDKTPQEVADNFIKIIDAVNNNLPNTEIVIQSVYPVYDKQYRIAERGETYIPELNGLLKEIAIEKGAVFADIYPVLCEQGSKRLIKELSDDGLHPNEAGYRIISGILNPLIDSILSAMPPPATLSRQTALNAA